MESKRLEIGESELRRRLVAGDEWALDEIFRQFGGSLEQRLVVDFGFERADVDAILIETIYRAWTNRTSFNPEHPLFPWLREIARKAAIDFAEKQPEDLHLDLSELASNLTDMPATGREAPNER